MCKQNIKKEEFLAFLGVGLNALFTSRSEGKRWVDQTPVYALLADDLAHMFPGAFFIHMLRDGRKVVHSMVNFLTRYREEGLPEAIKKSPLPGWSNDFAEACRTWRRFVDAALEFQGRFPDRCLTVINEQISAEPAREFAEILHFIQAPHEDGPANFFRTNRINSSFVEKPNGSAGSQPALDPWTLWTPKQRKTFVEEAAATMLRYGLAADRELALPEETPTSPNSREPIQEGPPSVTNGSNETTVRCPNVNR